MGMMSTRSTTQTSAVAMGFRGDRYALRCIHYYSTSIVSSHDISESLRQLLCGAPWRPIIVHRPIGRAPFRNLSISRFRFQRITRSLPFLNHPCWPWSRKWRGCDSALEQAQAQAAKTRSGEISEIIWAITVIASHPILVYSYR